MMSEEERATTMTPKFSSDRVRPVRSDQLNSLIDTETEAAAKTSLKKKKNEQRDFPLLLLAALDEAKRLLDPQLSPELNTIICNGYHMSYFNNGSSRSENITMSEYKLGLRT